MNTSIHPTPEQIIAAFDEILDYVYGRSRGRDYPSKFDKDNAQDWIDLGLTVPIASAVFYHQMSRLHERWLRNFDPKDKANIPQHIGIFEEHILSAIQRVQAGGEPIASWEQSESKWRARIKGFYRKKLWQREMWGPEPGEDGCRAPPRLLAESKPKERKKTCQI